MTDTAPVPEELLANIAFIRGLAKAMLLDASDAEDVAQEACRIALEHPPANRKNVRGWLARVAQNLARRSLRSAARRLEHERASARDSAPGHRDPAFAQDELLALVVEAVRSLHEPYRSVIMARFYEGLSVSAVAERHGVSVETIHTRSRRALARLRDRLGRAREDWRPALVLLAGPASSGRPRLTCTWKARSTLTGVVILILGAAVFFSLEMGERLPWLHTKAAVGNAAADSDRLAFASPTPEREALMSMPLPELLTAASLALLAEPPGGQGSTRLVSVGFDTAGNQVVGNGESRSACISANGRYVAFISQADNLLWPLGQDNNGVADVFVRDLLVGQTYLVSRTPTAESNGASNNATITPDGDFLVFDSQASNFPGDGNGSVTDIFRVDLRSLPSLLAPELVSLSHAGLASNDASVQPVLSDDGSVVAFSSTATNLTAIVPGGPGLDIYVRDLAAGTTVLVSAASDGTPANTNLNEDEAISGDGRYVVYWSSATNLHPADTNDDNDVFVFDRQTLTTEVVSLNLAGNTGTIGVQDRASTYPCISGDGHYISFLSHAWDLVTNVSDTNGAPDIFVRDTWTDQTVLVNLNPAGQVTTIPGLVDNGTLTADGRFLTFYGGGAEYGGNDSNNRWDVYWIDRDRDGDGTFSGNCRVRRASLGPRGEEGSQVSTCVSYMGGISRNGSLVVFESAAPEFTDPIDDTNMVSDVFVRDMRHALIR